MKIISKVKTSIHLLEVILFKVDELQKAVGRVELKLLHQINSNDIHFNEFKVYSQWGEDGIIQFLINKLEIKNRIFVEFGVQNYTESNTRFLLQNNNWSGLVIDGSPKNIQYIKNDPIYWRYNLKADCSFIDKDNINDILISNGIVDDIGLLSIDVDGNDYWILDAINCVHPRILICEYNSLFGYKRKVTIPYDQKFVRTKAHFSNLYYGASIAALEQLAKLKGYSLVGSNSVGNNLFFVRSDLTSNLPTYLPEQAYVKAQFCECRDIDGNLTFLDFNQRLKLISEMPLYDLGLNRLISVNDLVIDS